jgi:diguanylate cyclase (GGDEF)-like protein
MNYRNLLATSKLNRQYINGSIITLLTILAIESLNHLGALIPNPAVIYLTAVVYTAFRGGLGPGFMSAAITLLYALYFFSTSGHLFSYTPDNMKRVIVLIFTTPTITFMAGMLKLRSVRALQDREKLVIDLKELLAKVEALSKTDPLTGLFNRRRFTEVLESEYRKASRYKTPLSCMMIDIDHFKVVNDTYGHAVGDTVIKDVALIIQRGIRDTDTTCRWGGEEFVVLSPMTTKENAMQPARRILKLVSEHVFSGMGEKKTTISIGVADLSCIGTDSADKMVSVADKALYEAKDKGGNRVETAM